MLFNKWFIIYVYMCVHYIFVQDYDTYPPLKKNLVSWRFHILLHLRLVNFILSLIGHLDFIFFSEFNKGCQCASEDYRVLCPAHMNYF